MLTKRKDSDGYTEIAIWNEGEEPAYQSYRITCFDVDSTPAGGRVPPTARIALLAATQATPEGARRFAREYDYVADVAEALQAEKRAVYATLVPA